MSDAGKHILGEWVVEGLTVYALNDDGTNRFDFRIQKGWAVQDASRTSDKEAQEIACLAASAPNMQTVLDAAQHRLGCECGALSIGYRPCVGCRCRAAITKSKGSVSQIETQLCPSCDGTGKPELEPDSYGTCHDCEGVGFF